MMTKAHEKLLVAILVGLIIAGAAMFAVGPGLNGHANRTVASLSIVTPTLSGHTLAG